MKPPGKIFILKATGTGATASVPVAHSDAIPAVPVLARHSQRENLDSHLARSCDGTHRYYLHDWLHLHGLTAQECEGVLSRADIFDSDRNPDWDCSRRCDLSGDLAWRLASDAMLSSFPQSAELIENVRDTSVRVFHADRPRIVRPFTAQTDGYPVVVLSYRRRVVDLLTVAHEFGHAVQVLASRQGFVPPVNREICAFVSELTLLKLLRAELPALHRLALTAWEAGNRNYLGRHGRVLALALRDPQASYHYSWNYPIARMLASQCFEHLPTGALWSIFENQISLSGIVSFLDCSQRSSRSCTGACLSIAKANILETYTSIQ